MSVIEKIAYNTDSQEKGGCQATKVGGGGGITRNQESWSGGPGRENCESLYCAFCRKETK